MKTPHIKGKEIAQKANRPKIVIDASGKILGRVASIVAQLLIGKSDPQFSPFLAQFSRKVVVRNIREVILSGKKYERESNYWHTGYAGGIKEIKKGKLLSENPTKIFKKAVYGMLPKNRIRKKIIKNLIFD